MLKKKKYKYEFSYFLYLNLKSIYNFDQLSENKKKVTQYFTLKCSGSWAKSMKPTFLNWSDGCNIELWDLCYNSHI